MIHLTQLIYVFKGQEEIFNQFETLAIPIISIYNGRISLRVPPDDSSIIERNMEKLMKFI